MIAVHQLEWIAFTPHLQFLIQRGRPAQGNLRDVVRQVVEQAAGVAAVAGAGRAAEAGGDLYFRDSFH